jgi:hypothetical protein
VPLAGQKCRPIVDAQAGEFAARGATPKARKKTKPQRRKYAKIREEGRLVSIIEGASLSETLRPLRLRFLRAFLIV